MKLKSPEYLLAFHMRNNGVITVKRIIEMCKNESIDDFIAYCPEYRQFVEDVVGDIIATCMQLECDWQLVCMNSYSSRKEFASHIKNNPNKEFLFIKYDHPEETAMAYLMHKPTSKIKEMIKQYKERLIK